MKKKTRTEIKTLGTEDEVVKEMSPRFVPLAKNRKDYLIRDRTTLNQQSIGALKSNVPLDHNHGTIADWYYPEYNLSEIITITETEALVARAFSRKEIMCLKEGFDIVGKNQKTVQYIKKRLHEIELVSKLPTRSLIRHIAADLIHSSNAFASLVRNAKYSSGRTRKTSSGMLKPIAGIFMIPFETILFKKNDNGHVVGIGQQGVNHGYNSTIKEYKEHNYVHFKINERTGFAAGTPLLTATKDDILALRRIEEDAEIMLYQHLFPLYQYKVGTEKSPARPYPDGTTEVDEVRAVYSSMPSEGAIVTPERHELKLVSNRTGAMDPFPAIKHFKQRVLAGIEISSLDIGDSETSNRSTSDSLSRILIDGVKYLQRRIEEYFDTAIIRELLLESTFDEDMVLDPENMVHLKFKEIDIDEQVKVANHRQQLFSTHGITQSEFRRSIGEEPFSEEEREDTFFARIDEPRMLLEKKDGPHDAAVYALARNENSFLSPEDLSKEQANAERVLQQANAAASKLSDGSEGADKQSASQNRPSNQHGTKAGSNGRKSSSLRSCFRDATASSSPTDMAESSLLTAWDYLLLQADTVKSKDVYRLVRITLDSALPHFVLALQRKMNEGLLDVMREESAELRTSVPDRFRWEGKRQVINLLERFYDLTNEEVGTKSNVNSDTLRSLTYRIRMIEQNELARSYNTGRANGYKQLGHDSAIIVPLRETDCSKCNQVSEMSLKFFAYMDAPPTSHPNARQIVRKRQHEEEKV